MESDIAIFRPYNFVVRFARALLLLLSFRIIIFTTIFLTGKNPLRGRKWN